jgi:hypothetical protein
MIGQWPAARGIGRKWSSLRERSVRSGSRNGRRYRARLWCWLRLWSTVLVRHVKTNFAGILALAVEGMPSGTLTAAWDDDFPQIDPCLADKVRPLVVVEDGYLELEVVAHVVDVELQLLVPVMVRTALARFVLPARTTRPQVALRRRIFAEGIRTTLVSVRRGCLW